MKKFFAFFLLLFCAVGASAQSSQSSNSVSVTGVSLPPAPVISSVAPTQFYINTAATFTLTGTGFSLPCTASWDGAVMTTTFISATSLSLAVPAAKATSGTHGIVVSCPVPLLSMSSPVTLPNAQVAVNYSADLGKLSSLKGGVPPYQFKLSSGSLPTGLSLSASGIVSGTPSGAGSFSFGFTVKDASGLALRIGTVKDGILSVEALPQSPRFLTSNTLKMNTTRIELR